MKFLSLLAKQISSALFWMSPKETWLCDVHGDREAKTYLFFSNGRTQGHRNNPPDQMAFLFLSN